MNTKEQNYKASSTPRADIQSLSYPGQDPNLRLYKYGYEDYFESLPILRDDDEFLTSNIEHSKRVMQVLAMRLQREPWLKTENMPAKGEFVRTILALETPKVENVVFGNEDSPEHIYVQEMEVKEGAEIVLAKWGDGHSSPVHGHANGYIHEEILYGKMKVNNYRLVNPNSNKVRLTGTDIVHKGTFVSMYAPNNSAQHFKRQNLIHNFTAVGDSASLHFLPEHTRDGRDNRFEVEYFEDTYDLREKLVRISTVDGMYAQKGDVILVRSSNVPEFGDHYIVITGHPVMKLWGLRPQDVAFDSPNNKILKSYPVTEKLVLLKLNKEAQEAFHEFHGIKVVNGQVIINNNQ